MDEKNCNIRNVWELSWEPYEPYRYVWRFDVEWGKQLVLSVVQLLQVTSVNVVVKNKEEEYETDFSFNCIYW